MVTAIAIMGGVCLLSLGVTAYLTYALFVVSEELREKERKSLDVPPIKWDYTRETGWVDAEVEDVADGL
jgi:hypothetical protein